MKRNVITFLILAAAIGAYAFGMETSAFAFIVLGCGLELWFWVRALRLGNKTKAVDPRI